MKVFYTYIYLDPTKPGTYEYGKYKFEYEPFYVGKGQKKRFKQHLRETIEENCNKHKIYKIKKIKSKSGLDPVILKIKENITNNESLKLEIELIKLIGRKDKNLGPLTNMTNGGDGTCGLIQTDEMRKHQSDMQKGREKYYNHSPEVAENFRITRRSVKLKTNILQYDLNGNFIKEWDNLQDLRDSFESPYKIKRCSNSNKINIYHRAGKSKLFLWSYHRIYNFIWIWDSGTRDKINTETILITPILKIDNSDNIIESYHTMLDLINAKLNRNRFLSKFNNNTTITHNNINYKIK